MKKIFQRLHTGKLRFKVCETCFPLGAPLQGNVIGSHYVLIVVWVTTYLTGIARSRN